MNSYGNPETSVYARVAAALEQVHYLDRGEGLIDAAQRHAVAALLPAVRELCEELGLDKEEMLAAIGEKQRRH